MTMVPAGNKAKRLSSVNHTTKKIHDRQGLHNIINIHENQIYSKKRHIDIQALHKHQIVYISYYFY